MKKLNQAKFLVDGKRVSAKEIIESVDDIGRTITHKVVGGDITEAYPSFKMIINVIEGEDGKDNLVKVMFEYEKKSEGIADPHAFMGVCVNLVKEVERHHLLVPN